MSDAKTLIDTTISASGGEASGTMTTGRSDQSIKLYIKGDSNSTNLDLIVLTQPDELSTFYQDESVGFTGNDITGSRNNAVVRKPDTRPSDEIKVVVVNNAASDTSVTVKAKPFLSI